MFLRSKKGQAFSEYAIFIGIILAAFMAMQHYLRNSVSGKLKAGADYMLSDGGEDVFAVSGKATGLYDPLTGKSMTSSSETAGGKQALGKDGGVESSFTSQSSSQFGTQTWKTGTEED